MVETGSNIGQPELGGKIMNALRGRSLRMSVKVSLIGTIAIMMVAPLALGSLLNVTDPSFDDNGPGTYQYPTASAFQPGAFDIQQFQVFDDGTTIYFLLTLRNLDPTFGSPLGAQLIDVFLHDPSAATTSTAAPFPTRNYTIAPTDAWSRLLEVQGFAAGVYMDAQGNSLGTITTTVDATSRTVMFTVPAATLGHPGPGWDAVVTVTGQDGFSADQARSFAPTPQGFAFGVCAVGGNAPICSVDPATVPKVVDTITPPGVSQATELDPTLGPVVLFGVSFPEGGTLGPPPGVVPEPSTLLLLGLGLFAFRAGRRYKRH